MNKFVVRGIVTVLALTLGIGGGWVYFARPSFIFNAIAPAPEVPAVTPTGIVHDITYTDDGFSPKDVTIGIGDTVRWVNKSSGMMWVASSVHPTHSVYSGTTLEEHCVSGASGTAFDQCGDGTDAYTFVFTKAGTWRYHDHINAFRTGSVIVTE